MKTQHICTQCGEVMYETGGQLTVVGKLFMAAVFVFALTGAVAASGLATDGGVLLGAAIAIIVNGLVMYGVYRLGRHLFRK